MFVSQSGLCLGCTAARVLPWQVCPWPHRTPASSSLAAALCARSTSAARFPQAPGMRWELPKVPSALALPSEPWQHSSGSSTSCLWGHMSTTTTIIDGKNGSVPSSPMKVGKKSVTEDLVTTFSSPAAWLLVVALIVTWSAVAIVMFDLVDYKTLAGEVEPSLKKEIQKEKTERPEKRTPAKATHRDKPEKQEKIEKKEPPKVTSKDKLERQEKAEKKEKHAAVHKEKPEKPEKQEKKAPSKVSQKDAPERHEKAEKKPPPKEEKKVKSTKVEAKVKKEVKDGKGEAKTAEKVKKAETKATETGLIKAKTKVKEEKALQTVTKSDKKGAGHKEFVPPRLLLEHSPRKKPAAIEEEKSIVVPREVKSKFVFVYLHIIFMQGTGVYWSLGFENIPIPSIFFN
uniref:Triadin n=1 Tax=Ficedula albicollis TaxID=59894 RepID=A0A803VYV4_FICAL